MLTALPNLIPSAQPVGLANTHLPGTLEVRVAFETVAPSVANAQVQNNAQGNNTQVSAATAPPLTLNIAGSSQAAFSLSAVDGGFETQSAFFAQVIAQQGDTSGVPDFFALYDKLAAFRQVRYQPSEAYKPPPEPVGIFGRILQQQKTTGQDFATVTDALSVVEEGADTLLQPTLPQAAVAARAELPLPKPRASGANNAADAPLASIEPLGSGDALAAENLPPQTSAEPITLSPPSVKAAGAYTATIVRNNTSDTSQTLESA